MVTNGKEEGLTMAETRLSRVDPASTSPLLKYHDMIQLIPLNKYRTVIVGITIVLFGLFRDTSSIKYVQYFASNSDNQCWARTIEIECAAVYYCIHPYNVNSSVRADGISSCKVAVNPEA